MIRSLFLLACLLAAAPLAAQTEAPPATSPANPHGNDKLDCASCHAEAVGPGDKVGEGFDHSTTGFELVGAHKSALCRDCHHDPDFRRVGVSCADCHSDAHKARLGPDCEKCHTPAGWQDRQEMRRRHDSTALPLTGAHTVIDCDACHAGPVGSQYVGTPSDCFACHAETWAATRNPPHQASGFGTDCVNCHGVYSTGWSGGDFRHPASFPLTGGHAVSDCRECHTTGDFGGLSTDCYSCHRSDYEGTNDPNHIQEGFPTSCAACHNTSSWEGADFNHNITGFALTGAHAPLSCRDCHSAGYTNTSSACVSCHQDDYDRTTNPNHAQTGFPTDCAACHSSSAWRPSTWNHDNRFPISSGRHSGFDCIECHVVPTNYSTFECILCHTHDRATTDAQHQAENVRDYSYVSSECYRCHPQGRAN